MQAQIKTPKKTNESSKLGIASFVEGVGRYLSTQKLKKSSLQLEKEAKRIQIRPGFSVNVYDSSWKNTYKKDTKTIVFIHGGAGQLGMWGDQVKYFEKDYRVIAYDLMGHGKTDNVKKMYNRMNSYAMDLRALLYTQKVDPKKTVLVGYSLGANVAYNFSRTYEVDRTVFMGMHLSKSYVKMSYRAISLIVHDVVKRKWPQYRQKTETDGFLSAVFSYINETKLGPQRKGRPVLILSGTKDIMTPVSEAKGLNKEIPNSSLILFKDAGHDLHNEKNFNYIIRNYIETGKATK